MNFISFHFGISVMKDRQKNAHEIPLEILKKKTSIDGTAVINLNRVCGLFPFASFFVDLFSWFIIQTTNFHVLIEREARPGYIHQFVAVHLTFHRFYTSFVCRFFLCVEKLRAIANRLKNYMFLFANLKLQLLFDSIFSICAPQSSLIFLQPHDVFCKRKGETCTEKKSQAWPQRKKKHQQMHWYFVFNE